MKPASLDNSIEMLDFMDRLKQNFIPLKKAPDDTDTGTKNRQEVNHYGWISLFYRMTEIEKKHFLHSDQETLKKVEDMFYQYLSSMISLGFDVNKELIGQQIKPLHKAAMEGCKITAFCLLKLGAKVNEYDDFKQTALYRAAFSNQIGMVKFLIENKANVNQRNEQKDDLSLGKLALHVTTSPEIISLLVTNGSSVNAFSDTPSQYTALHWAVFQIIPEAVEKLLNLGSQDCENQTGDTALEIAKKKQCFSEKTKNDIEKIVKLLKDHQKLKELNK